MGRKFKVIAALLLVASGLFIGAGLKKEYDKYHASDDKLNPIIRLIEPEGGTFCTAVVISNDLAVTANHCINIEQEMMPGVFQVHLLPYMEIRAADNIPRGLSAAPLWWDFRRDIAIIKGDFTKFLPRKYLSKPEDLIKYMKKDIKLVSCGYPYHGPLFCNQGFFVDRVGFHWGANTVVLPGMSGGPTMLEDGTVVGINDAVEQTQGGLSIISPTYDLPVK